MKKYAVGVVGATGMVGQRFVSLLEKHPWFQLTVVAASARSAGKPYGEVVQSRWAMPTPLPEEAKSLVILDAQADMEKIAAAVDFIFCAVDMVNCRKYVSNKQSYSFIRRTSDRLCREQGLSVVKPGQDRGQSYAEWDAQRRGRSWKAKLKIAIDAAIPQAKDFDDFLRLMERQGYEIKRGKFVSFRAPGQERFTRCKTLGEAYTEEAITERIQGRAIAARKPKVRKGISLRIDIENSIKAQQSAGYTRWAKIHNLQQAAKTMNFLTEHGIDAYSDLESRVAEISAASEEAAAALKTAERRLGEMAVLIKNVTTYKQTRPVAVEYRRAADKSRFRQEHESALILYEAAGRALREGGVKKLPDLAALKAEYARLSEEKERLYARYSEVKKELKEYGIIKQNVDGILRVTPRQQERKQEL